MRRSLGRRFQSQFQLLIKSSWNKLAHRPLPKRRVNPTLILGHWFDETKPKDGKGLARNLDSDTPSRVFTQNPNDLSTQQKKEMLPNCKPSRNPKEEGRKDIERDIPRPNRKINLLSNQIYRHAERPKIQLMNSNLPDGERLRNQILSCLVLS